MKKHYKKLLKKFDEEGKFPHRTYRSTIDKLINLEYIFETVDDKLFLTEKSKNIIYEDV